MLVLVWYTLHIAPNINNNKKRNKKKNKRHKFNPTWDLDMLKQKMVCMKLKHNTE